jgi:HEAT repeat protein
MKRLSLGLACLLACATGACGADVASLLKKLGDPDNEVRRSAAKDLGALGKDARPAIKALIARLARDKDLYVRRYSAEALGAIGPDAREAVPALRKALNDEKKQVAEAAVVALGKMGPGGVPALLVALKSADLEPGVRKKAADALGDMGPAAAKSAVPTLTALLKPGKRKGKGKRMRDEDDIRLEVVTALGKLATPSDRAAVSALEGLLDRKKNRDRTLRKAANDALRKIKRKKK